MKCQRNDLMYMSNPPQSKCVVCGKFWRVDDPIPDCDKIKPKGHWRSGTGQFNKPTLIANAWNELTELRLKDGEDPQLIKDEVDLIAKLVKMLR